MKKTINVMFTGDSITDCERARPVGEGFGRMGNSYVSRIFVDTWADNPEHHVRYYNSATSGDTSLKLLERFDSEVLAYEPDYLFIMIGVNDVWRHFDGSRLSTHMISTEETARNMETMIQKCQAAGTTPVIVSPFFLELNHDDPMRKMVDDINESYRALAKKYDLVYIDVQSVMDDYIAKGYCYLLSQDRVHPKAVGISLIARTIYNTPLLQSLIHD